METELIHNLNKHFAPKVQKGTSLPEKVNVRDGGSFYLLDNGIYVAYTMLNGNWEKNILNGDFEVVLEGDSTAGMRYGYIYTDTTIAVTISASTTPTEIKESGAGFTVGLTNGIKPPALGSEYYLKITETGTYKIDYSISMAQNSPSAAIVVELGIMVDGTAQDEGVVERNVANSTDVGAAGGTAILSLNPNQVVSLYVNNKTNTTNIDVTHANLSVVKIGE